MQIITTAISDRVNPNNIYWCLSVFIITNPRRAMVSVIASPRDHGRVLAGTFG